MRSAPSKTKAAKRWVRVAATSAVLCFGGSDAYAQARTPTASTPSDVQTQTSLPAATLTARADEVTLTLAQALERAASVAPELQQASGDVQASRASQRTAMGAYLPSLSLSASTGVSRNRDPLTGVEGAGASYGGGVSVGWDVFTGLRRGAEQDRTEATTQAATARLESQRFAVAVSVQRAFYDALRADELEAVAKARIGRAEQGVEAARQKMTAGTATRSDLLRAQLELNTARQSELQAQTQGASARFALGRLAGLQVPARPKLEAPLTVKPLPLTHDALVDSIAAESPSVRAATATVTAAEASERVARAQYFPTARLSAGYDWLNAEWNPKAGQSNWSVRLGLSFPVFDGLRREETNERARIQSYVSKSQLSDAQRAARSSAEQSLRQLELQEDRIELAQAAVDVAREDLRVQQERYRLGVTTMLDLLTSQSNLVQAETDLVSARFDYQLARADLEALAGRTL